MSEAEGKIWFRDTGRYRLIRNGIGTDIYFDVEQDETFRFELVEDE